jgi:hypothetical protein
MKYTVYEIRPTTTYARLMYQVSAECEDDALEQAQLGNVEAVDYGELDYLDYGESGWAIRSGAHDEREAFKEAATTGSQEPITSTEPEMLYACPNCKSHRVQSQMWVSTNTGEVLSDTDRYAWCQACEDDGRDGEIRSQDLLLIPAAETREGVARIAGER